MLKFKLIMIYVQRKILVIPQNFILDTSKKK